MNQSFPRGIRYSARRGVCCAAILSAIIILLLVRTLPFSERKVAKSITLEALPNISTSTQATQETKYCPSKRLAWNDPLLLQSPQYAEVLSLYYTKEVPVCRPPTPLFIAFASTSCMLEQTLLSFITEGWPASQIVVFDNTGVADLNAGGTNPKDYPTYLNYTQLQLTYGVAIYQLPVRLSFSQFQNYLLSIARRQKIPDYFWAHQDIVVRSHSGAPLSFYDKITEEKYLLSQKFPAQGGWAFIWFAYDNLAHVNVAAADLVGLWNTLIPYYYADCDYYRRVRAQNLAIVDFYAGPIWSLAECVDHKLWANLSHLDIILPLLAQKKRQNPSGRNTWQGRMSNGKYTDDFGPGWEGHGVAGKAEFARIWRTTKCT